MKQDFDEFENDPYFERIGKEHAVVNGDLIIGQAGNGHIQVYDKNDGHMVMHINCSKMLSDEEMVDTVFRLMGMVAKNEAV